MSLRRPLTFVLIGLGLSLAAPPAAAQGAARPASGQPGTTVSKDRQSGPRRERTIICRGAPIPTGWILVNDMRDPSSCGGENPATLNAYNVWSIERTEGRLSGTIIDACAGAQTPTGWTLVDVFRDRELCGHPEGPFVANVKRIRKN